MAAHADDLAERDLTVDAIELRTVMDEGADARVLRREMVELEDDRIRLPAVNAGMPPEVLENVRACRLTTSAESLAGLPPVDIAAVEEVLTTTSPTSVLTLISVAAEGNIRQESPAA